MTIHQSYEKQSRPLAFWEKAALGISAIILLAIALPHVAGFILNAAERESQWRAERLCRDYGVCDTKRGA